MYATQAAQPGPQPGLIRGTTAAATRGKWNTKKEKKNFTDCKGAAQFLNQGGQTGEADSRITPSIGKLQVTKQGDGTFKAKVRVDFFLDPKTSTMTLPDWRWPNMTAADRAAVEEFVDEVTAHEVGHMDVAEQVARDAGDTRMAVGLTADEAKAKLQTDLHQYGRDVQAKLDKGRDDYDYKTNHGRKQSNLPGGKDVRMNCP